MPWTIPRHSGVAGRDVGFRFAQRFATPCDTDTVLLCCVGITSVIARVCVHLQAYKKLSLKYHPDRNKSQNATQMFQRLTAARDMLLDAEAKAAYVQVRR